MTPEENEEKVKGIAIVGGPGMKGYNATLAALLLLNGFQIADQDAILSDRAVALPEEEDCCQDISDCYDINNGRLTTHTPPFYTQTKRDIYRNPKGNRKGRR